jgi:hypothetical protein
VPLSDLKGPFRRERRTLRPRDPMHAACRNLGVAEPRGNPE